MSSIRRGRLARQLVWLLSALVVASLLVVPGSASAATPDDSASGGRDAVSGVVHFDPRIYARPTGPTELPAAGVTNVDTTNDPAAQNETSIDISPVITTTRVLGDNDYRTAANNDSNCGFARSSNAGATWASGILLGVTKNNGGPFNYDAAGDPSVMFADNGTVYYGCLAFDRSNQRSAILVDSSTDGGVTWATPVAVVQSTTVNLFHDKDMLTIDNNVTSAFHGRLYIEWTEFLNNFATSRIVISHSTDGGATWSTPTVLSATQTTVEGPMPAVGPDGTVYASWCSGSTFCDIGSATSTIYVVKSTDGGVTWSAPVAAHTFTSLPASLPHNAFRVSSFPTIGVSPTTGTVFVAHADYSSGDANIDIVSSSNGGVTWGAPILMQPTTDQQFFQWLRVSPTGSIAVCYYDEHWNTKHWLDMSCSRSANGATFTTARRTTTQSSNPANDGFGGTFIGDYTGLAIDSANHSHTVWTDTRTGNADVFTAN